MSGAQSARLPDGRLHLQHGPIDLVIEAFGTSDEVARAHDQATARFGDVLEILVRELVVLRRPVGDAYPLLQGPVARRMAAAVWPYRDVFITPMAAVAGSVADEILEAMECGRTLHKAYVNNGGDIAVHLTPGHTLRAGIVADVDTPALAGLALLSHERPVRGIATSGWSGRSFSLGIADSVTVLAASAAAADAAATIIANAVNADHPAIERRPANTLQDDSDLGDRLVTTGVGALPSGIVVAALDNGIEKARHLRRRGLIDSAALSLKGQWRIDAADTVIAQAGVG
jgi:ApbE superfamily uncharacterized protein (UPF0280 family)